MKVFIAVIVAAIVIGGFVGGELTARTFMLTGAVIGGVGTASVLLGLGAFFDAQERKRRAKALPPEMRGVFDRMFSAAPSQPAKPAAVRAPSIDERQSAFLSTTSNLLSLQLLPEYSDARQAFPALMTNKRAAGYVFGFHDASLQKLRLRDPNRKEHASALVEESYKHMVGQQAGHALFSASLNWQSDADFMAGRMIGGEDLLNYLDKNVPPLGLNRILILGLPG